MVEVVLSAGMIVLMLQVSACRKFADSSCNAIVWQGVERQTAATYRSKVRQHGCHANVASMPKPSEIWRLLSRTCTA
jgi:hypothetical protein